MSNLELLKKELGVLPTVLYSADSGGYDISGKIQLVIGENGIFLHFCELDDKIDWIPVKSFELVVK